MIRRVLRVFSRSSPRYQTRGAIYDALESQVRTILREAQIDDRLSRPFKLAVGATNSAMFSQRFILSELSDEVHRTISSDKMVRRGIYLECCAFALHLVHTRIRELFGSGSSSLDGATRDRTIQLALSVLGELSPTDIDGDPDLENIATLKFSELLDQATNDYANAVNEASHVSQLRVEAGRPSSGQHHLIIPLIVELYGRTERTIGDAVRVSGFSLPTNVVRDLGFYVQVKAWLDDYCGSVIYGQL